MTSASITSSPPPRLTLFRHWSLSRTMYLLPIIAILFLQTAASLSLHNTAFQDEALYVYAGRAYVNQIVHGVVVDEPYGLYLSGLPFFYPIIAGVLDNLGGLELVRMFSLACMLFTTVMVYLITQHLYRHDVALLAAGLFAVQGSVIFLGRLATYDALCLALLGLATLLAVCADVNRGLLPALAIGFILFAATAAKYAGLLFVPEILALMAWQTLRHQGLWRAVLRGVIAVAIFAVCIVAILALNADVRVGISATTTNRTALESTPPIQLLDKAIMWVGGIAALAVVGLLVSIRKRPLPELIFFATILLAPAYHIYKLEATSMQKHMAFSALFAAPLAAAALAWLAGFRGNYYLPRLWLIAVVVLLVFWNAGLSFAQGFYGEWTDSTDMINMLRTQVRPSGRYLAEESEVPRYYLQDIVSFWQWNNLYWFAYTDKTGKSLEGIDAYKAAIKEGYWDLIIFRYGPSEATAHALDSTLNASKIYELLTKIPVHTIYGDANYWVWRKRPSSP